MIIESVITSNMDVIQSGFDAVMRKNVLNQLRNTENAFSEEEYQRINQLYNEASEELRVRDFGRNLSILFEHVSITYKIKNISILEALVLKKFACGNMIDINTYLSTDAINKEVFPRSNKMVHFLDKLMNEIENDNDIKIKPGGMLFPAKSVMKDVIVTFEGASIQNLIGAITQSPECYFVKLLLLEIQDKLTEQNKSDILIQYFMKSFYTYMHEYFNYIDYLSDSITFNRFLDPAKSINKVVVLSHINVLNNSINFLTGDQKKESEKITSLMKLKNDYMPDVLQKSTKIFVTCNTSFYTFLESFIYLPIGMIIESTDIKILMMDKDFEISEELGKYIVRIRSIIESICKEREKYLNETDNIDRYNLILLNSSVQFTMKFNLYEISDILLTWEEKIKRFNIYGEKNVYIRFEMLKMINEIKQIAIAVNNMLK